AAREARTRAGRGARRALHERRGGRARRRGALRGRGARGRADRRGDARPQRLRLRPALLLSALRSDLRGGAARRKGPREPPRQGLRAAAKLPRGARAGAGVSRPAGKHALVFVVVTVLLDIVGFGLIIPVLPRLLVELTGDSVSQAAIDGGWLAFVYAAMQFVCAPVLGNLSDRHGRRPVLLFAVGALGVDYVVMGLAPTLAWLFLGRAISGMAGASFTPAYAYVADVSPPEKRAQNFGLISAAFGVGFILGPALGGFLGTFGTRTPFFAAAALSLVNLLYGTFVLPESLPLEARRPFDWRRANPLGTLLQMRKHPVVLGLLGALFLWMVAHQVMPATWTFYTKFRFGWSEMMIGASLAAAGVVMAVSQAT